MRFILNAKKNNGSFDCSYPDFDEFIYDGVLECSLKTMEKLQKYSYWIDFFNEGTNYEYKHGIVKVKLFCYVPTVEINTLDYFVEFCERYGPIVIGAIFQKPDGTVEKTVFF